VNGAGRTGRFLASLGVAPTPRPVPIITLGLLAIALAVAVVGLAMPVTLPPDDTFSPLARFGTVVGVLAAAQLLRLRFRVGTGLVSVSWGEAALIIGLHLVPPNWMPAATLLGVGLAWALLAIFADRRSGVEVLHTAAALTIAVTLATVVTTRLASPFGAEPTIPLAAALAVGALTYLLVAAGIAGMTLALRPTGQAGSLLLRALHGKLPMFVGNIVRRAFCSAYVGYWVDGRYAGRGITPTALALVTDHAFNHAGLHRIEVNIRPENRASRRVVEKLGFRQEALHRRYLHIDGDWRDHLGYALTVEDVQEEGGLVARWHRIRGS